MVGSGFESVRGKYSPAGHATPSVGPTKGRLCKLRRNRHHDLDKETTAVAVRTQRTGLQEQTWEEQQGKG